MLTIIAGIILALVLNDVSVALARITDVVLFGDSYTGALKFSAYVNQFSYCYLYRPVPPT